MADTKPSYDRAPHDRSNRLNKFVSSPVRARHVYVLAILTLHRFPVFSVVVS